MRVLLIDEHEAFREGLALALKSDYGFDVLHTGSVADAVALVGNDPVEVAVITRGLEEERLSHLTSALVSEKVGTYTIILAEGPTDPYASGPISDGVAHTIPKRESISVLADAIQRRAPTADTATPPACHRAATGKQM